MISSVNKGYAMEVIAGNMSQEFMVL